MRPYELAYETAGSLTIFFTANVLLKLDKVLRKVVALRKQDQNERQEQEAILDLYLQSLGMAPSFEEGE